MQIVIKLSDKIYDTILNDEMPTHGQVEAIVQRIYEGTPLPKGHGRIKDIDKIEWYGCTTAFDCPYKDRECKDCDRAECSKTQVDDVPTIIEADSEEDGLDNLDSMLEDLWNATVEDHRKYSEVEE